MNEWIDPDNLEDPENTTQDLLNELANESDEIAGKLSSGLWELRQGMCETTPKV